MTFDIQTIIAIISGLATIILFFPSFYTNVINPILSYNELRKSDFKLTGNWSSSWEPKAINEPNWVDETITIKKGKFGKVILRNENNDEGYSFTCIGKIYKTDNCKFLYGHWYSNSTEDDKKGRFLLTLNPRGYMIGNFFGPNTQGVMMTGGWVLGKNLYHLETGKLLYGKGFLNDNDVEVLKEIKKRLRTKP
jgi:hypothetical protein